MHPTPPAVPREVGPPPGGPDLARMRVPVVFFTPRGLPGESREPTDTVTAALRAIRLPGAAPSPAPADGARPPAEDEAEYAWLPPDNIKPFAAGDISGTGEPPVDPQLPLCIGAAERAMADDAARRAAGAWGLAWAGCCCHCRRSLNSFAARP